MRAPAPVNYQQKQTPAQPEASPVTAQPPVQTVQPVQPQPAAPAAATAANQQPARKPLSLTVCYGVVVPLLMLN